MKKSGEKTISLSNKKLRPMMIRNLDIVPDENEVEDCVKHFKKTLATSNTPATLAMLQEQDRQTVSVCLYISFVSKAISGQGVLSL